MEGQRSAEHRIHAKAHTIQPESRRPSSIGQGFALDLHQRGFGVVLRFCAVWQQTTRCWIVAHKYQRENSKNNAHQNRQQPQSTTPFEEYDNPGKKKWRNRETKRDKYPADATHESAPFHKPAQQYISGAAGQNALTEKPNTKIACHNQHKSENETTAEKCGDQIRDTNKKHHDTECQASACNHYSAAKTVIPSACGRQKKG